MMHVFGVWKTLAATSNPGHISTNVDAMREQQTDLLNKEEEIEVVVHRRRGL